MVLIAVGQFTGVDLAVSLKPATEQPASFIRRDTGMLVTDDYRLKRCERDGNEGISALAGWTRGDPVRRVIFRSAAGVDDLSANICNG